MCTFTSSHELLFSIQKLIDFCAQTLESDSYVCIREKKNEAASPEVIIIDLKNGNAVTRRSIKADSAIMYVHFEAYYKGLISSYGSVWAADINTPSRRILAHSPYDYRHFNKQIIALRAQARTLQIFDLSAKAKLKSATMNEDVVFWKFTSENILGLVTETAVYHWDIFDPTQAAPVEVFKRNPNLQVSLQQWSSWSY